MSTAIPIIGLGDDGLDGVSDAARQLIRDAEIIVGDDRTLSRIGTTTGQRMPVGSDMDEVVEKIAELATRRIVVVVYGDPLFYGWARYLCDKLGKDRFDVLPHVTSMQLAFARVMESWDEAYLTNLAHHSLDHVIERIRTAEKVGLFTTDEHRPRDVAATLLKRHIDYFHAYVCENLGSRDECVTQGSLADIAEHDFSPLNVMILIRQPDAPDRVREAGRQRLFGNPEAAFAQSKPKQGLLTPAEVRAMALAQLDVRPTSTVWDVGAGSGSVSVEAAHIASGGQVYAIEMDGTDFSLIGENIDRFGVTNVTPILGKAPEAWADLPDPDCVFVEGTGREARAIVEAAYQRLRAGGRLVANLGSIENLSELHALLSQQAAEVNVWMINIARGTYQMERIRFDALNPTFLLAVVKGE